MTVSGSGSQVYNVDSSLLVGHGPLVSWFCSDAKRPQRWWDAFEKWHLQADASNSARSRVCGSTSAIWSASSVSSYQHQYHSSRCWLLYSQIYLLFTTNVLSKHYFDFIRSTSICPIYRSSQAQLRTILSRRSLLAAIELPWQTTDMVPCLGPKYFRCVFLNCLFWRLHMLIYLSIVFYWRGRSIQSPSPTTILAAPRKDLPNLVCYFSQ